MKTDLFDSAYKFAELEAKMQELGLTREEVIDDFLGLAAAQYRNDCVPSPIPFVYKEGNGFKKHGYLLLPDKHLLWGFEIQPGVFLAKDCGLPDWNKSGPWEYSKAFIKKMACKGRPGKFLSRKKNVLEWNGEKAKKLKAAAQLCWDCGIAATALAGDIQCREWYADKEGRRNPAFFSIERGRYECEKHSRKIRLCVVYEII